jgi:hypothetical protein
MRAGLWTVCLHPNMMSERELDRAVSALEWASSHIVDVAALPPARPFGLGDMLFQFIYVSLLKLKRLRASGKR